MDLHACAWPHGIGCGVLSVGTGTEVMIKQVSMIGVIAVLSIASACSRESEDRILFDGYSFRAKAKLVDKKTSPTDFTVTVKGVSVSLDGAREAGRYEATRFCIQNIGSSKIDWRVGPDTDPQNLQIVNNTITFVGSCQRP